MKGVRRVFPGPAGPGRPPFTPGDVRASRAVVELGSAKPVDQAEGRQVTDARQIFPPWERPIPGKSRNFQPIVKSAALAAAAGATAQGPSLAVPNGYSFVVRGVNIFALNTTASFNVTYFLRFAGTALGEGYSTFGRVAASLEVPFSVVEVGKGPGTLDILIVNNNANAWTVGASFTGWLWSTNDGIRLYGDEGY